MAVRIRLKRMGAKKAPFYRIVVADSRSPRDGRFIEEIGYYDPLKNPVVIKIDQEKALDWLKKGAQLSETAKALFNKAGVFKNDETVTAAEEGQ
ncbi:MAG: 30S ribosomal protein S16 [Pelotomaculaceae bacterium]|jgi:small subunit ribosomal protein S16|uniref:30S ribosomal protein S16 n=1 Tax=anaerobic digester metagenome TaxID=1263854 RepID=A0A485LZW0_9ZZZZ|nr:30S ribosomal protein S16 [Bacillota bacterium]HHU86979.1 30S ribosomal protein S16 [Peptococcaceae bacterium]